MKITPAPDFADWKQAAQAVCSDKPIPSGWITIPQAAAIFDCGVTSARYKLKQLVVAGQAESQQWKKGSSLFHIYRLKK